jgi:hypothetical protein
MREAVAVLEVLALEPAVMIRKTRAVDLADRRFLISRYVRPFGDVFIRRF